MAGQPTTSFTTPANGTAAFFTAITTWLSAGWVITSWSDATTYTTGVSLTTNPFGGSGSGAGNLGNASAWWLMRSGDSTRWWLFQRSTDANWTIYRGTDAFTGGSPNATTIPTSTTQALHTSAAPGAFWNATPGRLLISCDAVADATYSWRMGTIVAGGGNVCTILKEDKFATGTYPAGDTDPAVSLGYFNTTGFTAISLVINASSTAIGFKRFRNGLGGAGNARITYSAIWYSVTGAAITPPQTSANQPGPEPVGGTEVALRIVIFAPGTTSNTSGYAGQTGSVRWSTVFGRANGQTMYDGTNYWIFMAGVYWLWDSSTPTI